MKRFALIVLVGLVSACSRPVAPSAPVLAPIPLPTLAPIPLPTLAPIPLPTLAPTPAVVVVIQAPSAAEETAATEKPAPTPPLPPEAAPVLFAGPPPRALTPAGLNLILEFEVGGHANYDPRPEAPDARLSGITWGIGYDAHQNSPRVILGDWLILGERTAQRLSDTHPYVGRSAQAHLPQVRDILVHWRFAYDVFERVDVAREFSRAMRAYGPEFDGLRPNAQAALISVGFNRGYSFLGANRSEMREVRRLVPLRDYAGMAAQIRSSERVWRGTEIYRGMLRRRIAEANLLMTP